MNSMTTTCSIQHNTYSINNNSQYIYKKCTVITDNNNMIWNKSLKKNRPSSHRIQAIVTE